MSKDVEWAPTLARLIFEPEIRRHGAAIQKLIERNNELSGKYASGFHYLGNDYGQLQFEERFSKRELRPKRVRIPLPVLHLDLMAEMELLLQLWHNVEFDHKQIRQFLFKLLQPCETDQDVRNAMPEGVVALEPTLAALDRTAEVAWTLQDDPRALRQWEKVREKISSYCAVRLLY